MLSFKSSESVYYLVFIVVFLILAVFASQLYIYLDDASYIFPSLTGNYLTHFSNYLRDNGFNRPFALFYYYAILKLYAVNSQLAHLIPLSGFIIGGFILFKILILQGLKKNYAFLTSLFILSLPFAAEVYSWFSASIGVWALLIFYLEIYLIEKFADRRLNIILIVLLQSIVSFFYETTLFMAIPLAYLIVIRSVSEQNFNYRKFFKNLFILFLPAAVYLTIKISVPHTIPSEFEISKFTTVIKYFGNYISQFYKLFFTKGVILFWLESFRTGLSYLFNSLLFALLFLFLIFLLFSISLNNNNSPGKIISSHKIIFWLLVLLSASLPLVWKKYYLPFRTLYLPLSILLILFSFKLSDFIFHQRSLLAVIIKDYAKPLKLAIASIAVYFLFIQITMLEFYQKQYRHDLKVVEEIRKISENLGYNSAVRTNLMLVQMPHNTLTPYIYGDYILSMFNRSWTAVGFIDLHSGTIKEVAIENIDNNFYSSKIDKADFMRLRPLTVLKFNGIENCYIKRCFQVEFNAT